MERHDIRNDEEVLDDLLSMMNLDRLDDKNRVDYEIWLPAGTYILKVRNPLTNEEWEITLEV